MANSQTVNRVRLDRSEYLGYLRFKDSLDMYKLLLHFYVYFGDVLLHFLTIHDKATTDSFLTPVLIDIDEILRFYFLINLIDYSFTLITVKLYTYTSGYIEITIESFIDECCVGR